MDHSESNILVINLPLHAVVIWSLRPICWDLGGYLCRTSVYVCNFILDIWLSLLLRIWVHAIINFVGCFRCTSAEPFLNMKVISSMHQVSQELLIMLIVILICQAYVSIDIFSLIWFEWCLFFCWFWKWSFLQTGLA